MAFDKSPAAWIEDWDYDAGSEVVTVGADALFYEADVPANWDATTGNISEIIRGILSAMKQKIDESDADDRPVNLIITRTLGVIRATGQVTETFRVKFITDPTLAVAAE